MKRFLAVTVLAVVVLGMSGCGCNRPFMSLFNRGDKCNTCVSSVSANHLYDGGVVDGGIVDGGGSGITTLGAPAPGGMRVTPNN